MLDQYITLVVVILTAAGVLTIGGLVLNMQDKINALVTQVGAIKTSFDTLASAWAAFKANNPGAIDTSALEAAVTDLQTTVANTPAP